jgi:hypothetical protein
MSYDKDPIHSHGKGQFNRPDKEKNPGHRPENPNEPGREKGDPQRLDRDQERRK